MKYPTFLFISGAGYLILPITSEAACKTMYINYETVCEQTIVLNFQQMLNFIKFCQNLVKNIFLQQGKILL